MIKFYPKDNLLILEYSPERGVGWVFEKIQTEKFSLKETFTFTNQDIYKKGYFSDNDENEENHAVCFKVGVLENDYYKINKKILHIDINVFFEKNIDIKKEHFIALKKISIFKKMNDLVNRDIYISSNERCPIDHLPFSQFKLLIDNFPNYYELRKYTEARVNSIIKEYIDVKSDAEKKYEKCINKKHEKLNNNLLDKSFLSTIKTAEKAKYQFLLENLEKMLDNTNEYSEKNWQSLLIDIILVLYPKYIKVFEEVSIKGDDNQTKRLDYMVLDEKGNFDIIEIKKPTDQNIMSLSQYRNNYIPLKELSGTIMQIEKYIFYLNKWGKIGEDKLTQKYESQLPQNFKINIINPIGIIIMGRENNLKEKQVKDFEIVKRKYRNIADIITYDEILNRLRRLIEKFS